MVISKYKMQDAKILKLKKKKMLKYKYNPSRIIKKVFFISNLDLNSIRSIKERHKLIINIRN